MQEKENEVRVKLLRKGGSSGFVAAKIKTENISAREKEDYEPVEIEVQFQDGELEKFVPIKIFADDKYECDEKFEVQIKSLYGNAKTGDIDRAIVIIQGDEESEEKMQEILQKIRGKAYDILQYKTSYMEQFKKAANVNDGDIENATTFDMLMHVLSFPWKMLFAFVPPPGILNGWLCFIVCLTVIGFITAIVGDTAAIFGCLINLEDSITAISFVAMGTSLPDTFASVIAAKNDKTADNAIGNITGSNSVNVFLGLGLPWTIAAIYWATKGLPFTVPAGDLSFSVVIFCICCLLCLTVIFLRRFLEIFGKGELGGPSATKWGTTIFFIVLWILYILFSVLKTYKILF